jgi:uncharacterized integral membrane protein
MPWRLFFLIVVFAVLLAFIGFNLTNVCDISFGFVELKEVPVFLTVFVSFALGLVLSVPFIISKIFSKKAKPGKIAKGKAGKVSGSTPDAPEEGGPYGID